MSSNKLKGILLQEVYDDITNKDGWSDMYKQKCISTVKRFYKRYGIILSDHACTRFVSQKTGKGKKHYSETDLVSIWNKNANYKESNNRLVKFQNEIAIIYNIMNNIVVSIVVRKKPKKSWEVK